MQAYKILKTAATLMPEVEVKTYVPLELPANCSGLEDLQKEFDKIGAKFSNLQVSNLGEGNYLCNPSLVMGIKGLVLFFSPDFQAPIPETAHLIDGNELMLSENSTCPIKVRKIEDAPKYATFTKLKSLILDTGFGIKIQEFMELRGISELKATLVSLKETHGKFTNYTGIFKVDGEDVKLKMNESCFIVCSLLAARVSEGESVRVVFSLTPYTYNGQSGLKPSVRKA